MRASRLTLCLVASCLTLAACGGGGKDKAASTTTSTASAGSTTIAASGSAAVAPLTGLPQPDAARRNRVALVVKIDNAPNGRPQTGLNQADVVFVEQVEGHITRLFTIFQTNDSNPVGPVRSARSTDIALVTPLDHPLFAYAGTNAAFQALVDKAPLVDVGFNKAPKEYHRTNDRKAPYNLYSSTQGLYTHAPAGAMPPPALFTYRAAGQAATGDPAATLHIDYQAGGRFTKVDYAWDAAGGGWKRTQDGTPFADSAGVQVAPKNVIVQFVNYHDTGQRDRANTAVNEAELIGSGDAWIFTDGKVVKGRWSKPSAQAVTAYTDATGKPVGLTPGITWVELPPPGSATAQ